MDLTPRQAQILDLVRNGKSNKEIAEVLGIDRLTVGNHLRMLYVKAGIRDGGQKARERLKALDI